MIDMSQILAHLQHPDVTSLLLGAIGGPAVIAAVIKAIKPVPALLVGRLKAAIQSAVNKGNLDAPTQRLFAALWQASFKWADEELPLLAGPAKMEAILDKAATVPYLGTIISLDRAGARSVLQAEYDAMSAALEAEITDPAAAPTK